LTVPQPNARNYRASKSTSPGDIMSEHRATSSRNARATSLESAQDTDRTVMLTPAPLGRLLEGIDWRIAAADLMPCGRGVMHAPCGSVPGPASAIDPLPTDLAAARRADIAQREALIIAKTRAENAAVMRDQSTSVAANPADHGSRSNQRRLRWPPESAAARGATTKS
jgi:hypothetical protein